MKIAILSRYQNTIFRGAETFALELSTRLSLKHKVDILSGRDADSLDEILKGDYQIVLAINGISQSFKASLGRLNSKYKLVITGQAGFGRGEILNIAFAKPDLYVALTEYMYNWAKKFAWGSRVVKIPNGVDINKFNKEGEKFDFKLKKPVVLSVGALVWYKHHKKTIQAISSLTDVSLVIVGKGPQKKELKEMGDKLLGNRFKILTIEYEDMPKIYRGADLFVLPSWEREAFGIVYLEAMASGLGVVAPNDLTRKEIVGDAGILVSMSNTQEYAQAIEQAIKVDFRIRALNQAKKFSWDKIANMYERAFEDILK